MSEPVYSEVLNNVQIKLPEADMYAPVISLYSEDEPKRCILAIYRSGKVEVRPTDVDKAAREFVSVVQELSRPKTPREDHKAILELLGKDHGCVIYTDGGGHCSNCERRADLIIGAGWTQRLI